MSTRWGFRWLGVVAAVAVLAGCGGEDGQPSGDHEAVPEATGPAPQTAPAVAPEATPPTGAPAQETAGAEPAGATAAPPDLPPASPLAQYAQAGLPRSLIDAGCYACHDVNGARIGPPLRAVAGLYRNDPQAVDKLTQKIIHGGGGVWGPTPMIAHPQLDEAEVRAMVEAILELN